MYPDSYRFAIRSGTYSSLILPQELKKREQSCCSNSEGEKICQREQQCKEDTRRKIILGALIMEIMKKGELDEKKILKKLDSFLTKDIDRKLFDWPSHN